MIRSAFTATLFFSSTLFAQNAGKIVCWGNNSSGQCDAPLGQFIDLAGGSKHSVGLREDGTVVCWGSNQYGQCDAPEG
ncbi:MAG: RCC1 domain-containing protein, partial [Candidatus Thermoplasmatota archaeon]|nr:RCC1 domain-containing protein [Candidatus Thermoplasmatota archaeon]